jgi:hypothetical protein
LGAASRTRRVLLLPRLCLLAATFLVGLSASLRTEADGPRFAGVIAIRSPLQELQAEQADFGEVALWKVVYVVGEIDGADGPGTQQHIEEAQSNAATLRSLGLEVTEFLPPDNHWEDIKAAALDAHALVYAGHGVYNWDGDPAKVGGFMLTEEELIHPDRIRHELRMLPDAFVLLNHVCFSAGDSASDAQPIDLGEAQRRVAMYSQPFLDVGLSAYLASNYYGFVPAFSRSLLKGDTFAEAYRYYPSLVGGSVAETSHPDLTELGLWLLQLDGHFDHAFAGHPELRFTDLYGPISVAVDPDAVAFEAVAGSAPQHFSLLPAARTDLPLRWQASVVQSGTGWLEVENNTGLVNERLNVIVTPPERPGTYWS